VDQLRLDRGEDDAEIKSKLEEISRLKAERLTVPATDAFDPNYKRLRYCRYADDFLIGIIGSKDDARQIMEEVRTFLSKNLKLSVSDEKSGIRKASDGARFLGYDVRTSTNRNPHKATFYGRPALRRGLADRLKLNVPREKVVRFVNGKGWGDYDAFRLRHRPALTLASDVEIVMAYNAEWRDFANYYALADDVKRKLNKGGYFALMSCVKTVAAKHKTFAREIFSKMRRGQDFFVRFQVGGETREIKIWQLKDLKCEPRKWGDIDRHNHQSSCSAGQKWSNASMRRNAPDAVEQIFHVKSIMSERSRKWRKQGLPGTCRRHDYASALCFASPVIAPSMLVAKLTNDVTEHVVVESRMR